MNKRGSIFLGVTIGIFIYIMGVLFIPFITDDITTTRIDLDCTNTSVSGGTMITCLMVDTLIPYLILFFVSLLVGFIIGGIH